MLKRMFVVVLVVCAPLPLAAQSVYELVGINAPNGNAALVKHSVLADT